MTLPFYPFYWKDYSSGTFDLTQSQHGAYMLLLRKIYTTGEPIPHEQRYSIAKALLPVERENVDLVLKTYFDRKGSTWTNSKASEVMSEWEQKHENRVNAGKSEKKPREQSRSNASAMPKQRQNNQNQNQNQLKRNIKEKGKGDKMPFVLVGTEAFRAWEKFKGRKINAIESLVDGERKRGFYFPSEFPPAVTVKAKKEK